VTNVTGYWLLAVGCWLLAAAASSGVVLVVVVLVIIVAVVVIVVAVIEGNIFFPGAIPLAASQGRRI